MITQCVRAAKFDDRDVVGGGQAQTVVNRDHRRAQVRLMNGSPDAPGKLPVAGLTPEIGAC